MLIRLTDYVERGVIDNRRRDVVSVRLYVKGRPLPIEFELEGNCRKDLAGCLVDFQVMMDGEGMLSAASPLEPGHYTGLAGDITASKRVKKRGNPGKLENGLYLELFSDELGMIVVEGEHYEIKVSPFQWSLDSCDEQAQIMCSQQVFHDYVQGWIKQFSMTQEDSPPLPDHRWDVRLREAEGVAIAYQEVHHKFKNVPCGDTSEAFVMGWYDMLGELADSEENGTSFCCRISGSLSLFDILSDEEAIEAQLSMSHPMFQQMIEITETAQKLFAKQINDLQVSRKPPGEELGIVFHAIRYTTPNILSCLLQINEGNARNDILAERLFRCASHIQKALDVVPEIKVKGISKLHDSLSNFHEDLLSMRKDLLNQSNL